MDAQAFAKALARRRKRLGWSKRRASRVLKVTLATYARWEAAECKPLELLQEATLGLLDAAIRVKERP